MINFTIIVETERRMQFWFNTTNINDTEDVIEAYFHIYKRRAIRPAGVSAGSHSISVSIELSPLGRFTCVVAIPCQDKLPKGSGRLLSLTGHCNKLCYHKLNLFPINQVPETIIIRG